MFKLVVTLSLVSCALGIAIYGDLKQPQLNGRIVGGQGTSIGSFPHQISLQKNGLHSCGGSLFSSTIVITAAHCVKNFPPSKLKVRAGSTSKSRGGVLVDVATITIHPFYNTSTREYDIATLRLSKPLTLGPTIQTIKMANSSPRDGSDATVSGWGSLKPGVSSSPDNLQYVKLKVVSSEKCSSGPYRYGQEIKSTMICGTAFNKDSCQGDSGGPLIAGDVQVGVVSWGYGCAIAKYPGVYTDISTVRSWIESNA